LFETCERTDDIRREDLVSGVAKCTGGGLTGRADSVPFALTVLKLGLVLFT